MKQFVDAHDMDTSCAVIAGLESDLRKLCDDFGRVNPFREIIQGDQASALVYLTTDQIETWNNIKATENPKDAEDIITAQFAEACNNQLILSEKYATYKWKIDHNLFTCLFPVWTHLKRGDASLEGLVVCLCAFPTDTTMMGKAVGGRRMVAETTLECAIREAREETYDFLDVRDSRKYRLISHHQQLINFFLFKLEN